MIRSDEQQDRRDNDAETCDIGHQIIRAVSVWGHLDEFGQVRVKFLRMPGSDEYEALLLEYISLDELSDLRADLEESIHERVGKIYDVKGEEICIVPEKRLIG